MVTADAASTAGSQCPQFWLGPLRSNLAGIFTFICGAVGSILTGFVVLIFINIMSLISVVLGALHLGQFNFNFNFNLFHVQIDHNNNL